MGKIKKYLLVIIILIACGCSIKKGDKLEDILKSNNYVIIDVRTNEEYNTGHLENAINIPYNEILSYNFDNEKTILVYCKSGTRSKKAYEILTEIGYNVYDLGAYESINLS